MSHADTQILVPSFSSCRVAVAALAFAMAAGCEKYFPEPLPPAPYVSSPVGTVFRYQGFTNRVVSSDGWVTRFVDDSGRAVHRIAGFITEDPAHPVTIDTSKLSSLWPLKVGNDVTIPVSVGTERWSWSFKVTGEQQIETPGALYRTFVVEAVQSRLDSAGGAPASFGYTLNYAPEAKTVVRFQTTVLSGKDTGRSFGSDLRSIFHPGDLLIKP